MDRRSLLSRASLSLGLSALGALSLVYGDFGLQWQPVPTWVPTRQILAYASGVVLLATAVGLLARKTAALASRVFFAYALLWLVLLKLPAILTAPRTEVNWLGAGEIAMIFSAAWLLRRALDERSDALTRSIPRSRAPLILFGLALIPVGLSHFVYAQATLGFVPAWLPFRSFWADLGGAGHILAGLGVLFGVYPRLAATLEAAMIGVFTVVVWGPHVIATPTDRLQWTGFVMSWLIGAAAWVVADALASRPSSAASSGPPDDLLRVPANARLLGSEPDRLKV